MRDIGRLSMPQNQNHKKPNGRVETFYILCPFLIHEVMYVYSPYNTYL